MDTGTVINIARQTVWIIVKAAVPVLLVSMIVGLVISLFADTYIYSGADFDICAEAYWQFF